MNKQEREQTWNEVLHWLWSHFIW